MYEDKNYPFTVGVPDCFRASFVSVNIISVAFCAWAELRCWPGPAPYSRNKSQTYSARFLCLFICLLTAWTHCLSEEAGKMWLQSIFDRRCSLAFHQNNRKSVGIGSQRVYVEWYQCISPKMGLHCQTVETHLAFISCWSTAWMC